MTTSPNSTSNEKLSRAHPMATNIYNETHFRNLDRTFAMKYMQALREGRIRGEPPVAQTLQRNPITMFRPRMDLFDDPRSSFITAVLELPGLKKQDISLRIEAGQLLVSGERTLQIPSVPESGTSADFNDASHNDNSTMQNRLHIPVQELKYGKYSRCIPLPQGTQPSQISANLGEGMLTISWPRGAAAQQLSSMDSHTSDMGPSLAGSTTQDDVASFRSEAETNLASATSRLRMNMD
ncbi:hypothetical protein HGRIS_012355 [Hohenbuehelia grisea]|uniref:SHSP domain-containing protein n=1 Tax=Hohenbuehelia grisea TaxID=104357 RepID=A0ABR3IRZ3_9AGAR